MSLILGVPLDTFPAVKLLILWIETEPESRSVGGSIPPLDTDAGGPMVLFRLGSGARHVGSVLD